MLSRTLLLCTVGRDMIGRRMCLCAQCVRIAPTKGSKPPERQTFGHGPFPIGLC